MTIKNRSCHAFKICCISATVVLIVSAAVLATTLALTVFKTRNPKIAVYPAGLARLQLENFIAEDSVSSDMVMSIRNRNYGSFEFRNATSYITYDGELVGWVPIGENTVPARSAVNITTKVTLLTKKLRENPKAVGDIVGGSLNVTARVNMQGKVSMMNGLIRKGGSVNAECNLTMYINEMPIRCESSCGTKLDV